MSWVAVAVVGGSVIGAGASIASGKKAAKAQTQASQTAADVQMQQYNQTREDLAPYRQAGYTALGQLGTGTSDGGDFNRDFTVADFNKDPGYQFRMDQGTQAVERSAAAHGGLNSGATLKALTRYGQDYASGEYSNAYTRFNADRDRRFNRLASLAGVGQTATNTGAQAGANAANGIADAAIGAGNSRAASAINTGNAINSTVGSLGQFYLQSQYLKRLPTAPAGTTGV